MSEKRFRKLLRRWQKRLGLGHYDITLVIQPFESDDATTSARINVSPDYERARIEVQPWLLAGVKPDEAIYAEDAETVLVHELLHVSFWPLRRAKRLIEDTSALHRDEQALFDEAWTQREEEAVDRLAVALVKAWRSH